MFQGLWAKHRRLALLAGGVVWTAIVFTLTKLSAPVLDRWGARIADLMHPSVTVIACSPLQDAKHILRAKYLDRDEILDVRAVNAMNETTVFVRNDLSSKLTNVRLLIHPMFFGEESDKTYFTLMHSPAIERSDEYEVKRTGDSYLVKIPLLHSGEFVLIENNLARPATYVVELSSDELTRKEVFAPGCFDARPGTIPIKVAKEFYTYFGPTCARDGTGVNCKGEDLSVPFKITEEISRSGKVVGEYVLIKKGRRIIQ